MIRLKPDATIYHGARELSADTIARAQERDARLIDQLDWQLADVVHVYCNGIELTPARSLKIVNHSPTGFEWGYSGSGPAQLALALLLHHCDDAETAQRLHQPFKFDVVSGFRRPGWALLGLTISRWLERKGIV